MLTGFVTNDQKKYLNNGTYYTRFRMIESAPEKENPS